MSLSDYVRVAIERRLAEVERSLGNLAGIRCERRGDAIAVRGRRLAKRSIEDSRLRFAGRGR